MTYKNDRLVGTKGGVAILVKKGIIVNQEWKNEHFNVVTDNEALAIEIELQNGDKVILATIYALVIFFPRTSTPGDTGDSTF